MNNRNNNKNKLIMHIDVDSFFASAEISIRPELKNKDIAIARSNSDNAVVAALSYSAKSKGAQVPMKVFEVKKYCPNIVVLDHNFNLYTTISNSIYNYLFKTYTKEIEIGSIDEWYLDITKIVKNYKNEYELAKEIQNNIYNKFKLSISIGISYNKFLAKMATDIKKPNGITITTKDNLDTNLKNLPIEKYIGIGVKYQQMLKDHNIHTINDLANVNYNEVWINQIFKNQTKNIIDNANGITVDDKIDTNNNSKTIANIVTFENGPTKNIEKILNELKNISKTIENRLMQINKLANSITVFIKYINSKNVSFSSKLNEAINGWEKIYDKAINLFNKNWEEQEIVTIGISMNNLISFYDLDYENNLFKTKKITNTQNKDIRKIINTINNKMGLRICYSVKEYKNDESISKNQSKILNK